MRRESKSGDRYIRAAVVFKSFIATLPASQLSWPDGHPLCCLPAKDHRWRHHSGIDACSLGGHDRARFARQSWLTLRQAL